MKSNESAPFPDHKEELKQSREHDEAPSSRKRRSSFEDNPRVYKISCLVHRGAFARDYFAFTSSASSNEALLTLLAVLLKSDRAVGFLLFLLSISNQSISNDCLQTSRDVLLIDLPLLEACQFLACGTENRI